MTVGQFITYETLAFRLMLCYTSTMKAQTQEDRTVIAINTRYPKALYDAIMRLAKKHRRSFHAEVLWALQTYIEQHEQTSHDEWMS